MKNKSLRRTMLFCPAINPKLYIGGPMYKSDCIIFDLEDAIRYDQKVEARDLLCEAFKALDFSGVEVFVRINPLYTEFGRSDVLALVEAGITRFRLPMCENIENVLELDKLLSECEEKFNVASGSCLIQCSIETPLGVENALSLATASSRVTSISFGAEDYTRLLGVDRTKTGEELFYARSRVCNAASIAGVDAIDTVWADFNDLEGFKKEVSLAKQLGFAGKSCIHPLQIDIVHDTFTPSFEEVEKSLIILEEVKKSGIEKGGVIQIDGKMIDIPVIEKAKKIVNLALGAGMIEGEYNE
ncbi:MAG: HpcH/HpaI aldolase/citrate lyase family protein [Bacilli bacterium]